MLHGTRGRSVNRLRIGFLLTAIFGSIYGAVGLFDSLLNFGIGMAVAGAAIVGYGLSDWLEDRHDARIYQTRQAVWARRCLEDHEQ